MTDVVNAQLYQYLKDSDYTMREAAIKIGVSYQYLMELANGTRNMTDSARLKIARAFPDTAKFILQLELPVAANEDAIAAAHPSISGE